MTTVNHTTEALGSMDLPQLADVATRPRPTNADRIVDRAKQLYEFVLSTDGEPMAVDEKKRAFLLGESGAWLMDRLAGEYHRVEGTVAEAVALRDALQTLRGLATKSSRQEVHLRHARHGSKLVTDIGDTSGKVIVVTPGESWKIQASSPVLFRRTPFTAPLPTPVKGKRLDDLRQLISVSDEGFELIIGWLIAGLFPDITLPILVLTGPQRTEKIWVAETLLALLDPSTTSRWYKPRTAEAWHRQASQRRGLILNDICPIRGEVRDAIVGSITGHGRAWQQPGGPALSSTRNVIVATTDDPWGLKGDLAEHQLRVEVKSRPDGTSMDEQALKHLRAKLLPGIFGALLTAVAGTLGQLLTTKLEAGSRLAEFERVLGAADSAHTTMQAREDFLVQQGEIRRGLLDRDPFGSAVRDFARNRRRWEGTPERLLKALGPFPGGRKPRNWPSPAHVSALLKRFQLWLKEYGVVVDCLSPGDDGGPELLRICVIERPGDASSPSAGPRPGSISKDDEQHNFHAMAMMNDDEEEPFPF